MARLYCLLLSAVFSLSAQAYAADTLFVSDKGVAGNGQSWESAYASINDALAAWQDGDEVWVARGTYTPPVDGWSFPNGLRMYGGFNGNEVLREERDWFRRPSVLAAAGLTRVFVMDDCDSSSRLDGFVLQGATGHAVEVAGGCPVIINCRFRNNTGTNGAAIFATGTTRIHIEYCVFGANQSELDGGSVEIRNTAPDPYGWGAFIAQCQFYNNTAVSGYGGGLAIVNSPTIPQIVSCVFNANQAVGGGALYTLQAYAYLTNCTFYNNHASGLDSMAAASVLVHGGELLNSIVWNGDLQTPSKHIVSFRTLVPEDTAVLHATANLVENDFEYGFYQSNPNFEDETQVAGADGYFGTDDDGLRLSSLSVARDAGFVDKYVNARQTDVIGNPRLVGRKLDLGAYESQRKNHLTPKMMVEEMKKGTLSFFFRHSKTDWDQKDKGPSPECFPGRNLIYEGRQLVTEVGKAQRLLNIPIGEVLSSPVCRCWETALLMCGRYEKTSYWGSGGDPAMMSMRDSALSTPPTGGNRVITSHDAVANMVFNPYGDGQVLTSAELMECDNLFVLPTADTFEVVGHWAADTWARYHVRFPDEPSAVTQERDRVPTVCYPNPASTLLGIETPHPARITVVNLLGESVWQGMVQTVASIPVSAWPQGSYLVLTDGHSIPVQVVH